MIGSGGSIKAAPGLRLPWVSLGLVAVLANVFALELRFPATEPPSLDTPSLATLLAFGAMNGSQVLNAGEWYRLCTATLLHTSPDHVVINGVALMIAGWLLEPVIGRAWFVVAYCVGGFGGAAMDLATASGEQCAVGASGAIMGVFTTGFFASFRLVCPGSQVRLRLRSLSILVPTLEVWFIGPGDVLIDHAGHAGGVLGGALVGLLLWRAWPAPGWTAPPCRLALVLAILGVMVGLAAAGNAAWAWKSSVFRHLAPAGTQAASKADADLLVQTYPADPQVWTERGRLLYNAHDYVAAERDFHTALEFAGRISPVYPHEYQIAIRGMIAIAISGQGRRQDAIEVARPVCAARVSADLLSFLREEGLCGG